MMKTIQLTLGALTVLALAGCTHPVTPRVEIVRSTEAKSTLGEDTGASLRLAIENQTYDVDAARNLRAVTGLDGVAAGIVMDQYRKSFEKGDGGGTKASVVGTMLGGQSGGR